MAAIYPQFYPMCHCLCSRNDRWLPVSAPAGVSAPRCKTCCCLPAFIAGWRGRYSASDMVCRHAVQPVLFLRLSGVRQHGRNKNVLSAALYIMSKILLFCVENLLLYWVCRAGAWPKPSDVYSRHCVVPQPVGICRLSGWGFGPRSHTVMMQADAYLCHSCALEERRKLQAFWHGSCHHPSGLHMNL